MDCAPFPLPPTLTVKASAESSLGLLGLPGTFPLPPSLPLAHPCRSAPPGPFPSVPFSALSTTESPSWGAARASTSGSPSTEVSPAWGSQLPPFPILGTVRQAGRSAGRPWDPSVEPLCLPSVGRPPMTLLLGRGRPDPPPAPWLQGAGKELSHNGGCGEGPAASPTGV